MLQDGVLETYSGRYRDVQGLNQLVEKAGSQILDAERRRERDALDEFFECLRDGETVAYVVDEVEKAIESGAVDTAVVSPEAPRDRQRRFRQVQISKRRVRCLD